MDTKTIERTHYIDNDLDLDDGESFFTKDLVLMKESQKKIKTEKKNPKLLKTILEKTENCTLVEKEPGLLYRKSEADNETLNSKVIQRIRFLIRDNRNFLKCQNKEEAEIVINALLDSAYDEYLPNLSPDIRYQTSWISRYDTNFNIINELSLYLCSSMTANGMVMIGVHLSFDENKEERTIH